MDDTAPLGERIQQMTAQLVGLRATLAQFTDAMGQIQDALLFHGHPELVGLDDEFEILYRGQM